MVVAVDTNRLPPWPMLSNASAVMGSAIPIIEVDDSRNSKEKEPDPPVLFVAEKLAVFGSVVHALL